MKSVWILAIIIRAILILYGVWHDSNCAVKYTDVDYLVFTDAARFIVGGESPYKRATYRYTPMLALILTPNIFLHPIWGKILFACSDIAVGVLIHRLNNQSNSGLAESSWLSARTLVCCWLFNPISINVSTRGNAEALISLCVLATIYAMRQGNTSLGGCILGLSIHLKLYPIIFALPLVLSIPEHKSSGSGFVGQLIAVLSNGPRRSFILACVTSLLILTLSSLGLYGNEFLQESILYHVIRTDHRHNFSIYFYQLYLAQGTGGSFLMGIAAFVPQIVLLLAITCRYAKVDIETCLFLQTLAFVAFNKVCTVQYWVWYMALAPLSLRHCQRPCLRWQLGGVLSWVLGVGGWLLSAYRLEMLGVPTWLSLLAASSTLLAAHVLLLALVATHTPNRLLNSGDAAID